MAGIIKLAFGLQCVFLAVYGADLGMQGHVFPVEEESLLEHIKKKVDLMSTETCELVGRQMQELYLGCIQCPSPVTGLTETESYRVVFFDPTISVLSDITDDDSNVIISKGTTFNPLSQFTFGPDFLFFDGSNEKHIEWAKEQNTNAKWILVKGKPLEIEERESRPIYFDQFGKLTTKFGIQHIPAKISQDGMKLKIEEIPVEST